MKKYTKNFDSNGINLNQPTKQLTSINNAYQPLNVTETSIKNLVIITMDDKGALAPHTFADNRKTKEFVIADSVLTSSNTKHLQKWLLEQHQKNIEQAKYDAIEEAIKQATMTPAPTASTLLDQIKEVVKTMKHEDFYTNVISVNTSQYLELSDHIDLNNKLFGLSVIVSNYSKSFIADTSLIHLNEHIPSEQKQQENSIDLNRKGLVDVFSITNFSAKVLDSTKFVQIGVI